jgi:multimeric flavodoxin WrbA
MNILVINGSPRGERSNSMRLTDAFLAGIRGAAEERQNVPSIEKLEVHPMELQPCLGCFSCWQNTPGKCCLNDDMESVIDKLLWADVTIWSFPLYYFGLPGKLKTLLDRQLPMVLPFMASDAETGGHPTRYDMSAKKTVLISTCGFYTAESNYDAIIAQFDRICGRGNYTALFCGQGELFRAPEASARTDEYLAYVTQAGREFYAGGIRRETNAKLQELLFPREMFERMADASWGRQP